MNEIKSKKKDVENIARRLDKSMYIRLEAVLALIKWQINGRLPLAYYPYLISLNKNLAKLDFFLKQGKPLIIAIYGSFNKSVTYFYNGYVQ